MSTYATLLVAGLVLAALTAVAGLFVRTPYGRFATDRLGPTVPQRLGWLMLELPAFLFFPMFFAGSRALEPVPLLFATVWGVHYLNRAVVFPLRLRVRPGARMGLLVPLSGWVVVPLHAWLYARWLSELGTHLVPAWLTDPRFLLGAATYLVGFGLTVHSEHVLRGLRSGPDDQGYRVPHGGGFRWVSSPHYLGELLAFAGLALAAWCPGGLFVLTISLANLVPRAAATHRWYHERFPAYPAERRALVPWLW